ncbi:DUF1983 domain-containing protein, partial [Escherichia coli]|nr:DUF1983 domain-containing protein [Escherichia coli]
MDFSVGAEGLRHVPGDVIEICDDDYAGISIGGRVLAVNSQTRTLTLDREITLPSSGTMLISLVDGSGNPVSVEVQSVTDGVKVKVSRVPDGVAEYSVWGLKLPTLRQRLFRCVSIRENDDGTYAITAVQHVPEKEAIVDNGAHFDGDQSGTVNGVTPPAVQHLTAEVTADSGEYQVLARWDTPKVVKGVSFMLRLTVAADDGSERLVSTARTTETTYRFTQLALGRYTLTVRAVNAWGQQGDPASVSFRIAAPVAPSRIELTPGYFQITATPHLAVYDPTVQFEFWFSETRITDIRQVETTARYLGAGLYWIAASINIKPGHDYYFYIRSVNTVGKSAFVEAVGRASDDAEGYLDFFKGKITESHLGKELLEKVDLTEDNASRLDEFSKEWKDANDKWNAMWGVKIEQTKDGKHYVAGIGLSMEDTEEGKLSQFLVAANRIAFIDPANGNETPMFVAQGNQIFMNDVFLKRLTAPTITSGGNPPVFSLTSDGKLTAKNADISGSVNANAGTLNNVTVNENCTIKGMLEATQVRGDFVKAVSKSFPKQAGTWGNTETPNGTVTVTISDDHNFDRQIIIPPIIFNGIAYSDPGSGNNPGGTRYTGYGFEVRKNGVLIASRETKGAIPGSYSAVIDMPSGRGAAKKSASDAGTSASEAATHATDAAGSARAASTSAGQAATSAQSASSSAGTASTKATEAEKSAAAAESSKSAAATSAGAAKTSETNAAASQQSAATSASTATRKASEAATSARDAAASKEAAKSSETNASSSASSAASSATAAGNSAKAAKTSETNAKSSETAAEQSASAAADSKTAAASSASAASTSAGQASASATAAGKSAESAASSASTATTKAGEATEQASAAASSASAAKTSETNAKASETSAESSKTAAASSASSAASSASSASASKDEATRQASAAKSSATTASTKATEAAGSATAAAQSKSTAESAATRAETAAKRAEDIASAVALEDASTTKKGIVQLSSATNSTSESLAATPKAVKAAYDLANGKYTAQDATTAQKGIIQLSSATNSTSETLAATPKAVKTAYDNAEKRLQKDQNGADIPGKDTFTKNIGACRAFGGSVSTITGNWTTAQFIEWLDSQGAFNHPYWMCKG